jgi:hypothetical protein
LGMFPVCRYFNRRKELRRGEIDAEFTDPGVPGSQTWTFSGSQIRRGWFRRPPITLPRQLLPERQPHLRVAVLLEFLEQETRLDVVVVLVLVAVIF